ncbi:type II secretion system protein GspL [Vibrio gallicus]|uniref:type II secretion system protein GspL n=1 Tax=Vibrio gallicus TaxID=190897 RepID=UPI0021C3FBA8|nr:type II secretion system protein GspL [Vibrio gallicus]
MSEVLTVRLSRQNSEEIPWLVWSATQQEIIASGELSSIEELSSLAHYAQERRTLLLLDSCDVILHEVEVPAGATRQLATMLPFLLEDDVAQDVDELHFTILKQTGTRAWTAAIERDYLSQCVEHFKQAGIELSRVIPDVLVLPNLESDITVMPFANHYLIRHDEFSGFSIEQLLLPVINEQLPFVTSAQDQDDDTSPAADPLKVDCFESIPEPLQGRSDLECRIVNSELPMQVLAKNAQLSSLTLLSGEFKRQSSWLKNVRVWRTPAIAAGILLALFSVKTFVHVNQIESQAAAYRTESERIFRSVFPDKRRIPTVSYLKRQMTDETTRLSGGTVEAPMLTWLIEVQAALKDNKNVKIQNLKYDGNRDELRIQAQANDFQTFEKIRVALSEKFAVEQGQINRNGDLVSSSYVLKVK